MLEISHFSPICNACLSKNATAVSDSSELISWYNVVFTLLCAFGALTNGINIIVFKSPKLKDKVYTCLLVSCSCEFLYLVTNCLNALLYSGIINASYRNTLPGLAFSLYIGGFFSGLLAIYSILVEIFLAFQRYTILINKPLLLNASLPIILSVLFMVSFIVHLPTLTNYCIVLNDPQNKTYLYTTTQFGRSQTGKILKSVSSWIRIILTLVVLTTMSVMTSFKSRQYFSKRARLGNSFNSHASGKNSK